MIMDAAVINGAVWTKMSPTPTPTRVIPPMAHELLSSFLVVMIIHLNIEALNLGQTRGKAYDKYHDYQLFTNYQRVVMFEVLHSVVVLDKLFKVSLGYLSLQFNFK